MFFISRIFFIYFSGKWRNKCCTFFSFSMNCYSRIKIILNLTYFYSFARLASNCSILSIRGRNLMFFSKMKLRMSFNKILGSYSLRKASSVVSLFGDYTIQLKRTNRLLNLTFCICLGYLLTYIRFYLALMNCILSRNLNAFVLILI